MSVIHTIDPEFNFWKLYPEFAKIEEFKKIKKEYSNSSDIMWFIVLAFDTDSKFFNIVFDDRVELLGKDYVKDKEFYKKNKTKIQGAIDTFTKIVDTPLKRHLRQWLETCDKRTAFLRDAEYDLDNFDKLDKMAANTTALLSALDKINAALQKQEGQGTTKSNSIPSLSDSEEI